MSTKVNATSMLIYFLYDAWDNAAQTSGCPVSWCLSDLPETNLQKGYNLNVISNSQLLALKDVPDVSTNIWFGISMKRLFKYQLQAAKKRQQQKTSTPLKFQHKSSFLVSICEICTNLGVCVLSPEITPPNKNIWSPSWPFPKSHR